MAKNSQPAAAARRLRGRSVRLKAHTCPGRGWPAPKALGRGEELIAARAGRGNRGGVLAKFKPADIDVRPGRRGRDLDPQCVRQHREGIHGVGGHRPGRAWAARRAESPRRDAPPPLESAAPTPAVLRPKIVKASARSPTPAFRTQFPPAMAMAVQSPAGLTSRTGSSLWPALMAAKADVDRKSPADVAGNSLRGGDSTIDPPCRAAPESPAACLGDRYAHRLPGRDRTALRK